MNKIKGAFFDSLNSLKEGFNFIWDKVSDILPVLIVALIVLVIGSWIAVFVGNKLADLLKKGKIDQFMDKSLCYPLSHVLGLKVVTSKLVGEVVKWVLLISVFVAVFNILSMESVINFIERIIGYLPAVFLATFIVVVGSLFANFVYGLIAVVTRGEHEYIGSISKLAINALAGFIALIHLLSPVANTAQNFLQKVHIIGLKSDILFVGVVILFVLAFKDIAVSTAQGIFSDIGRAKSRKGSKLDEIVKIES
ncbi:MAG: hypothetical protein HYZ79_03345 [Candidatus Melainabacteria bacterium]|nr:hypothetical protein [Candidatus Melainabacteria bacterium]